MTSRDTNGYGHRQAPAGPGDRPDVAAGTTGGGAHAADPGAERKRDAAAEGQRDTAAAEGQRDAAAAEGQRDAAGGGEAAGGSSAAMLSDRRSVVTREKKRYGGIKWGAAFFGWLTATGTAVILTAVVLAAGAAVGVDTGVNGTSTADQSQSETIGVVGGIALLVILLIAYYCGGYVAGRMSRFNGVKQGIAVWLWAIVIAVLVALAAALLGDKYDVLARLGGFPRLPISGGALSTAGIVALIIAVAAALVGAILGGLAGMRFHRHVDRAGLGD
jgi:hypothetical protein